MIMTTDRKQGLKRKYVTHQFVIVSVMSGKRICEHIESWNYQTPQLFTLSIGDIKMHNFASF